MKFANAAKLHRKSGGTWGTRPEPWTVVRRPNAPGPSFSRRPAVVKRLLLERQLFPIVEVEEEVVERLGQCGVSKNTVTEHTVFQMAHHRQLEDGHHLATLDA
jgi:hypothetical protein